MNNTLKGGLLALLMAASWWTAHVVPPDTETLSPVYPAQNELADIVSLRSDDANITIYRKNDQYGDYVWVESTADHTTTEPAPTDADPDATKEVKTTKTTGFLGNAGAQKVLEDLSPLVPLRYLENNADLTQFGLDTPKSTLRVHFGSQEYIIQIGDETYGAKDRYASLSGDLFLVKDSTVRSIEFGKLRLVDRALHPLSEQQIIAITITRPDGSARTLEQHNMDDRTAAFWAFSGEEIEAPIATSWLKRLLKLKVQGYKIATDLPEAIVPIMKIAIEDGETKHTLHIFTDESAQKYYATSSYNRATVTITKSLAIDLSKDLDALF
jgi:hypothetical protein